MPRIPYVDLDLAHERVREIYESLPVKLNLFRMFAHAERNFQPLLQLGGTILARQQLEAKFREHAILYIAAISAARYEWVQHVPIARAAGVTEEQISALEAQQIGSKCFDSAERAVLEFTAEVVRDVRPSDATLAALRAHLSDREVVELTLAIGYYMMVARVMEATGVELEEPGGHHIVANLEKPGLLDD